MPKGSRSGAGEGKNLNPIHMENKGRNANASKKFVFQNFAQTVAAVNIDVFHRLNADRADERELTASGSDVPLAMSTMDRWVELNCTGEFKAFRKDVTPFLLSLPLMLHKRDMLFVTLRRHLASASSLSIKPMLEVTAALAADLRQEFYPEFPPTLATLAALLRPSEVEMLEDVFSTLCYLFKYLLRQLLADLPTAFEAYRPLLSHERAHIRQFAAESFAYLLRRLAGGKVATVLSETVLSALARPAHAASSAARPAGAKPPSAAKLVAQATHLEEGIAHLLFHTIAGLGNTFHSRAPLLLSSLLAQLRPGCGGQDLAADRAVARVARRALHQMCEHTRRAYVAPVWGALTGKSSAAFWTLALRRRRLMAPGSWLPRGHMAGAVGKSLAEWHTGLGLGPGAPGAPYASGAGTGAEAKAEGVGVASSGFEAAGLEASEVSARSTQLRRQLALLCAWIRGRGGSRVPEGGRAEVLALLRPAAAASSVLAAAADSPAATAATRAALATIAAALTVRGAASAPVEDAQLISASSTALLGLMGSSPVATSPATLRTALRFGLQV